MKIRNGFVSNSSSSSYVIAYKGELTSERILEAMEVSKNSPLYDIAIEMSKLFVSLGKKYTKITEAVEDEDFLYECPEMLEKMKEGFSICKGECSDENYGNGMELAMVNLDFDYESEDLIIKKEAGY